MAARRRRPTEHDLAVRDQLTEASAVLSRHGRPDLADAVEYVNSPRGFATVERLYGPAYLKEVLPSIRPDNMPIGMERQAREHIKAAAKAAGDTLTEVVEEGLRAFVAGEFRPGKPARAAYGQGDRVNLNLRPDAALVEQAAELCQDEALAAELGWEPRVTTVARLWLLERYPLPETARTK
ncbi:MAG TPA: hypothetical protein VFY14_22700 [Streptomyces sp.]|nr:hypothetical protein [Streptomyces sp.]